MTENNDIKFTEEKLEKAVIELFKEEAYEYCHGEEVEIDEKVSDVLIYNDLKKYLSTRYSDKNITNIEIDEIVQRLELHPSSAIYESNKSIMSLISNGFLFKRNDSSKKDIFIQYIDYENFEKNTFKIVNQLEIQGIENKRIPDAIIYVNGIPLVVIEFKSAIREEKATIHDAYVQLTTRYKRDIPELLKYNAFCVISDGVNNKAGSLFAPYNFYYSWRRTSEDEAIETDGIDSLFSMVKGMFNKSSLIDIVHNFIFIPDTSKDDEKILCRYPQYYAANKLYKNIVKHQKPNGDGKGGTYFGATGSGKSFTMLYLTRILMKSVHFASPTIILITDRRDLDYQLSTQFTNAKGFIGDNNIKSVESRAELRTLVQNRQSGGVFLTTIHKFNEDIELLSNRTNIICISDEAHRSQTNLEQKLKTTKNGVTKTYGFAKYLHDSLPNATYVGFTGTPIDATLNVFGEVIDSYTMVESVEDEITVRLIYEGRAAKVILDNAELEKIEKYYEECQLDGASEYQIENSKKATTSINVILGDPDRLNILAEDFVKHYENRVHEGATIKGKAMFVSSSREIAYEFYRNVIAIKPEWNLLPKNNLLENNDDVKPIEYIKMVMTRGKDDPKELYDLIGTKEYRKELDRQFKDENSNFKIVIVVDMWLTGFDVPALDTIYIDKPIQKHNLIQTISRVNRKIKGKNTGLVVDYIGIKKQMNLALAHYNKNMEDKLEDIEQSLVVVKDQLDLLDKIFHKFDSSKYFNGLPLEQLKALNMASEFVLRTKEIETRFMYLVKRLKLAYDICTGSDELIQKDRDKIHFYLAIRSIIFKLTKGNAPDTMQMNMKVREMIKNALESDGVEEIFKLGDDSSGQQDIFDDDYLNKIKKIKLPNTKIKLLEQLLLKAISDFKKVNKSKGVDFSKKMEFLVNKYNERKDEDILKSEVLEDFTNEIIDLYEALRKEKESFWEMGIDFEEKAFYDILKDLTIRYDFNYPEEKLIILAREVKKVVDDKAKYPDWNKKEDIKSALRVGLIILLDKHGYPPIERDEVYKEIFEQAENFKKYSGFAYK